MKSIYTLLLLFLVTPWAVGQSLSGEIHDERQSPLAGATIQVLSSAIHTHSDERGQFTLQEINPGDTLEISLLGYRQTSVVVANPAQLLEVEMSDSPIRLEEVVVSPGNRATTLFSDINLQLNPVRSSQEVLRTVPGLIIGQHAGGGKAEQLFLRGFDIDHGTDLAIDVDGMPVNMVSHAHGQGYSDLHFLIPELIDRVDFGKGPYYADQGNFNTAGYVSFRTKDRLKSGFAQVEQGQFNTRRLLGAFNVVNTERQSFYVASELLQTDGPFESPQDFDRLNIMGKYTAFLPGNNKLSLTASHFSSNWDASGQIPQRAVDDGSITRFGAIDDTEGGRTSRTNLNLQYTADLGNRSFITNQVYVSRYDFELFSNFTFFLEDPENGDQIRQYEDRMMFGINSEYNKAFSLGAADGYTRIGVGLRNDRVNDNELSRTRNRSEILEYLALGRVEETNSYAYADASLEFGRFTINPGLRLDQFRFGYQNELTEIYDPVAVDDYILSPKINFFFDPHPGLQLYLKTGRGFHSNDSRVVTVRNGRQTLPGAWGTDLGFVWKAGPRVLLQSALWYLFLEQEFVYVGDAGIVEPSGRTQRTGVDLSLRYQLADWLFFDADATYTYARSIDDAEGNNYIPLAPDLTATGGLSLQTQSGFFGSLRARYVKDRPANEDYSIVAEGYTVLDLNAGYQWQRFSFGIAIENLLNTEWNETQFATESQLANESMPVEEIHFTPGTPFFLRGRIRYNF